MYIYVYMYILWIVYCALSDGFRWGCLCCLGILMLRGIDFSIFLFDRGYCRLEGQQFLIREDCLPLGVEKALENVP